ncbi:MAG: endonuclease III domain-containing protein [Brevinematia bacterium]
MRCKIDLIIGFLEEVWVNENSPLKMYGHLKGTTPFQILVSTILSLRTKDEITYTVAEKLFKKFKTPYDFVNADIVDIEKSIYPVGFYKKKAVTIKNISRILVENYNGDVPNDLNVLLSLPGVGRKTANLVLSVAFGENTICVDTHVHRISNRIGIVKTKTPEETETKLKEIVPVRYWKKINYLMVSFGQTICKPVKPKCGLCKIKDICEYFRKNYINIYG